MAGDEGRVRILQGQGGGAEVVLRPRLGLAVLPRRSEPRGPYHYPVLQQPPYLHQPGCESYQLFTILALPPRSGDNITSAHVTIGR